MKKNLQRIVIYFSVFIFWLHPKDVKAQWVTIPDTAFVNWLNAHGFASCMNGNQMDTTCIAIVNCTYLSIGNGYPTNITDLTGLQYFVNADTLELLISQLNYLPPFLNSVSDIWIGYSIITSLPNLPATLKSLVIWYTGITSLPPLPSTLGSLDCRNNNLLSLPTLPNSLHELWCGYNSLNYLPPLPPNLWRLQCDNNQLTQLPTLPTNILLILDCSHNQITSLPALPNTNSCCLWSLYCSYNNLTSLPALPSSLGGLYCSHNFLTSIPTLPLTLYYLDCSYNNISSVPDISDVTYLLDVSNNPNLFCLPILKQINSLTFINTGINCLPNYGIVGSSNPPLSSLPLCEVINTNGCPVYWNISGKVYADTNSNCLAETVEPKLANMKLMLYNTIGNLVQQTFTGGEGLYSFDTDTGTFNYIVDTTNNPPFYISCPANGFQTSTISFSNWLEDSMNFGINCKQGFDAGVNAIVRTSGRFRPGNFATVNFKAGDMSNKYGLHCSSGVSGMVTVIMAGDVSFNSSVIGSLTPLVNGDTITYIIADFGTVNFDTDFRIIVETDTTATLGSSVCFNVFVTPVNGDNNITNNNLQNCFTVSNSADPNEKEVYPHGNINLPDNKLTYTIRYQNTGNAPAENVYIIDTLDFNLDASTFELLSYNYEPMIQIKGNIVRFNFKDINLPDSLSNEPGSHGYVQYSIKIKDSLAIGTTIQNSANIYFDFNLPVQTNAVTDTLGIDCNLFASISYLNKTFCNGDTIKAVATLSYPSDVEWYVDSIFISNNQNISIPNFSIGSHEIKLVATNSYCTKQFISNIVINNLPILNLGNDITACPNIIDAGSGMASYLWSNGNTSQKLIASVSANYSVIVTDNNGCMNADTINVNIDNLPFVDLVNDTTGCAPLLINAGPGFSSYLWSNGMTTQTIAVNINANYSVIVTDSSGCANYDDININTLPKPFINLGNDKFICNPVTLINAGAGYSSYLWSTGQTGAIILINNSGTYTVTVTGNNGCTNADTINVTLNANPIVNLGNDTSTCNMPVALDAGSGNVSYQWTNGATTQSIIATITSNYAVTVTNTYGCTTSDVVHVSVHPLPIVELGNDTSTCNLPVVLNSGVNNASYLWSNGKSTKKITAHNSGTFSVIVTDTNGCSNTDSINVTINPLPNVNLGNDSATCNIPITLDAGAGNISYLWSNGETTQVIVANTSANYSVLVTDTNGCSNADTIIITINSLPAKPSITQNISLLTSSGAAGNQWLMNGNVIAGATNNTYNVALTGWYSVMVTDSNGCSNVSDSVYMDLTGVNDVSGLNGLIRIVPNPATSEFEILGLTLEANDVVTITDAVGKIVSLIKIVRPASSLKVETLNYPGGIYFVNIKTNRFCAVLKLIKD